MDVAEKSSWGANRSKTKMVDRKVIEERLAQINSVLAMLAKDEDLQDDLKTPAVQTALKHWTGINRLPPEKAQHLQDNRRAMYVMQKLQILQAVCREAQLAVPLDHLVTGKRTLSDALQKSAFEKAGHIWPVDSDVLTSPLGDEATKSGNVDGSVISGMKLTTRGSATNSTTAPSSTRTTHKPTPVPAAVAAGSDKVGDLGSMNSNGNSNGEMKLGMGTTILVIGIVCSVTFAIIFSMF